MADTFKGKPVTGTVSAGTRQAIEDYRWENRLTVSEVVRDAFSVWATERGIKVTEPTEGAEAPETASETPGEAPEGKTRARR